MQLLLCNYDYFGNILFYRKKNPCVPQSAPRIDSSDSNMSVLKELDCIFLDIFRHPGTFGPIFIKDFLFPVDCGIHTPINGMKAGMLVCAGLHCLVKTEWTLVHLFFFLFLSNFSVVVT